MKSKLIFHLFFLTILIPSCQIPQDPENSWEQAKQESLKVGLSSGSTAVERQMVEEFAQQHHLQIDWIEGAESKLVHQMKDYKIHLIIGDFEKKTIWSKEVGTTRPYDDKHVWLVARGENHLLAEVEEYFEKRKS